MTSETYRRLTEAIEQRRRQLGDEIEPMLAVALLVRTSRALTTSLDVLLRPVGSSFARHQVLNAVQRAGAAGIPLGEIAHELFLHPATVTAGVRRLEKEGCVRRRADASDRRTRLILLTEAGKDEWTRGFDILLASAFGIKEFPDSQFSEFTCLLDELMASALINRDQVG